MKGCKKVSVPENTDSSDNSLRHKILDLQRNSRIPTFITMTERVQRLNTRDMGIFFLVRWQQTKFCPRALMRRPRPVFCGVSHQHPSNETGRQTDEAMASKTLSYSLNTAPGFRQNLVKPLKARAQHERLSLVTFRFEVNKVCSRAAAAGSVSRPARCNAA
jgi:hypothetical protein